MNPIVLSLGAGVQSSTILLLSCHGLLPKIDVAIFADTGWERIATYQHLNWLKQEAMSYGIPVITVNNGSILNPTGPNPASMPFYGINHNKPVMLRRQCTEVYKIRPIRKKIRELFQIPKPNPLSIGVDLWLGISTDERNRVGGYYGVKYAVPSFPLIDIKPMSRDDCFTWLRQTYPNHIPEKSACVGCPFRDQEAWRSVKENPSEWKQAVEFDRLIRTPEYNKHIYSQIYLHRDCLPLDEIDLRTEIEKGQLILPEFDKLWGRQNDFLQLTV